MTYSCSVFHIKTEVYSKMRTYITNNCTSLHFYFTESREYDNPMIGSLFVNDEDYVRFCNNFLYYMRVKPTFGDPRKVSKWALQNRSVWYIHPEIKPPYPVMYLEDVEIHWIHEKNKEELLDKYIRRRDRFWELRPTPIFLLSCGDLCNDHSPEEHTKLVSSFLSVKTAIYVTREPSDLKNGDRIELLEEWRNESRGRDSHHIPKIHTVGDRIGIYKRIMATIKDEPDLKIVSFSPRNYTPIKNTYTVNPGSSVDIHAVVLYVSEHTCKIRLRRLDKDTGWDTPVLVKIGQDKLIVPKSETNYLIYEATTAETLEPVQYTEQKIPKTIIQTLETDICQSLQQYNTMMSFIELNPEYEYVFFDDRARREFIKTFFDSRTVEAYDTLVPGAYKADLFRYCYLYTQGGCYFDFKMILRKPLRDIIKANDTLLICSDYEGTNSMDKSVGTSYLNSLIMAEKGNLGLKIMIEKCVENILEKQGYFLQSILTRGVSDILDLTGPTLLYKILKDKIKSENLRFKHLILNKDETSYKNFVIVDFEDRKVICTKTYTTEVAEQHYSRLWERGELFYKNRREVNGYLVYVYPHFYPDVFEFDIRSRILTVSREHPWGLDLRIKIIGENSETALVSVGKNGSKIKTLLLEEKMFGKSVTLSNVFWETLVKPENIQVSSIIIAITSIIHVSDNPMGHNEKRSLVSPMDRFTQTIEQIRMVRKHIPTATLILLEMSLELPEIELCELASRCDYVIRYNSPESKLYCQTHHNKSLGEMFVMVHLGNLLQDKEFRWFCKLNGRYKFMENFTIGKFLREVPVANCIRGNGRLGILAQTIFYCVPKRYYKLYKEHFNAWLSPDTTEPVEHIFTMFLECVRRIETVETLDIDGIGAAHGLRMIL